MFNEVKYLGTLMKNKILFLVICTENKSSASYAQMWAGK